ncbi:uncharacterized protein PAC_14081 [Phialocephala subalpina]|uniref:SnoaL-like domain-containing protein n=1 Tax=Phialocephala subalpina TaxID=576137 RepID=A0A1L7XGN6_9HELO|nr:uncharacterized protein PAC_14081 [Phialocephala subalpina]
MSSTRRGTALAFLAAFENLDIDAHISLRAPTCSNIFTPSSQPPPLNNSGFAAHLSRLRAVIERFPVWPKEIMEDEKQNRVVIWATGEAHFKEEVRDGGLTQEEWLYKGEYMFIISLDGSGEKIERVVEFLDSKAADKGRSLVRRATGNLQHQK